MRYMSELLCYLVKAAIMVLGARLYQRVCERMAEQTSEWCIINNATSEMGNRANKLNSQLTWKNFSIHRPISFPISPAELDYSIICHLQPGSLSARSALCHRLLSLFNKLTKWKSIGVSIHILGYVWHCLAHLQ